MRMFREGTKETHGDLIGKERFCEELKKALGEAMLKIPSPHVSSVVIGLFLRVTYGLIRWQSRPKADASVKEALTAARTLREEKRAERRRVWREEKNLKDVIQVKSPLKDGGDRRKVMGPEPTRHRATGTAAVIVRGARRTITSAAIRSLSC